MISCVVRDAANHPKHILCNGAPCVVWRAMSIEDSPRAVACKCCHREFGVYKNPIRAHRYKDDVLLPRRGKQRLCVPCANVLHLRSSGSLSMQKQIMQDLGSTPGSRATWINCVDEYCEEYVKSASGRVESAALNIGDRRVEHNQASEFVTEMEIGILWPVKLYQQRFKEKLKPKDMTTVRHNGVDWTGKLMDAKFGSPPGTLRVSSRSSVGVLKTAIASASSDDIGHSSTDVAFAETQQSLAESAASVKFKVCLRNGMIDTCSPAARPLPPALQ